MIDVLGGRFMNQCIEVDANDPVGNAANVDAASTGPRDNTVPSCDFMISVSVVSAAAAADSAGSEALVAGAGAAESGAELSATEAVSVGGATVGCADVSSDIMTRCTMLTMSRGQEEQPRGLTTGPCSG